MLSQILKIACWNWFSTKFLGPSVVVEAYPKLVYLIGCPWSLERRSIAEYFAVFDGIHYRTIKTVNKEKIAVGWLSHRANRLFDTF